MASMASPLSCSISATHQLSWLFVAFRGFSTSFPSTVFMLLIYFNFFEWLKAISPCSSDTRQTPSPSSWGGLNFFLLSAFPAFSVLLCFLDESCLVFLRLTGVAGVDWTGEWDGVSFFASAVIFDGLGVNHRVIGGGNMIFLNDKKDGTDDERPDTALISSPAWCLIPSWIFATAESVLR